MNFRKTFFLLAFLGALLAILLGGCKPGPTPTDSVLTATPSPVPTATFTPAPPTPTSEPLAARVNGEGILLADYQAELARFLQANTTLDAQSGRTAEQVVLDELINQTLLAQAARQSGYELAESDLQGRIESLAAQVDLNTWMQRYGYDEASLRKALRREIEAAWMRDQILAGAPTIVEQVHVRQILLYNSNDATQVYNLLQQGQKFLTLAAKYEPATGGEIGWFPRGYLSQKSVEDAAFSLEVGKYSPVIESELGFHILYLVERDPQRALEPDALWVVQTQALQKWLNDKRQSVPIEQFVP